MSPPTRQHPGTAYPWRRLGLTAALSFGLLLGGGLAGFLLLDHRDSERQAAATASAWASAMSDQAATLLTTLDQLLLSFESLPTDESDAAQASLLRRERMAPAGAALALARPDGRLALQTQQTGRYLAGLDLAALTAELAAQADRQSQPGWSQSQLVLGGTLYSTVGPVVPLLRRLQDGHVGLALLPLRLLEGGYARLPLPPGTGLALLDRDGRLLASLPPQPVHLGRRMPGLPPAALGEAARWRGMLPLPAGDAYAAAVALPGLPVLQLATLQQAAALQPWRRRAGWGLLLATLALLTVGGVTWVVLREVSRRLAAQAAATHRLESLAQGSAEITAMAELPVLLDRIARLARQAVAGRFAAIALQDGVPRRPASDLDAGLPLPPEIQARLLALAGDATQAAAPGPRLLPGDGDVPPVLALPLQDAGGRPLGLILVVAGRAPFNSDDIATLQPLARLAEIALRNRGLIAALHSAVQEAQSGRARVETVLESIGDGFLALDLDWRVTYANGTARRLLATADDRPLLGQLLWERVPELAGSDAFDQLHRVAARGERADFTLALPQQGRGFRILAYAAGDGVALYLRDLPAGATPNAHRLETRRLALAGRLAGRMGPEFRALLAEVVGQAEALEAALQPGAPALVDAPALADAARRILDAAARGAAQWNRLQDLARPYPRPPQALDLAARLAEALPVLQRALGAEIALDLVAPEGLPQPWLEPVALENAVLALLDQAAEPLPPGSRVTLSLAEETLAPPMPASESWAPPGRYLALRVTGEPGPAGHRRRQARDDAAGPGPALLAVQDFARRQGGVLRLEERRLTLLLPLGGPAEAAIPLAAHILLVEDETALREQMAGQLRGLGYQVTAAADGPAALASLAAGPAPDLLLSDVVLPGGISGVRLAAELRQRWPGLPVLLMSAFASDSQAPSGGAGESLPLLAKPCRPAELGCRLAELLHPGSNREAIQ